MKPLPAIAQKPYRVVSAQVSTTGFVQFETNRYSVPTQHSGQACQIMAYPTKVEIHLHGGKRIAHDRLQGRLQKSEHPSHRERILQNTPMFKHQRMWQLMRSMDPAMAHFLDEAPGDPLLNARELFRMLKTVSRAALISAVREAVLLGLISMDNILNLFYSGCLIHPQDPDLLGIKYDPRSLHEYDELI